ncbi:MAG: monovalent cation/H+ antiporter complex subunit F [Eubacteriales bacterium]|jgi:multicomponent Na+:H+ antiporter subunit F|nr:monovalent cation/H+ antiporter complex subunit F [Eubacteriales bacterium]MDD4104357.1 monovalent cation/H+ antiporter complex subunit F [Eubacteriales bacterium]MDD4709696.1 monovalent cation/H+ antiporter complex subunit F [Eubacteriales bacterium]NLO15203.1 sodium:proton antiporter [Clostridiales bacterium]
MSLKDAYFYLYTIALLIVGVLLLFSFFRAIRGPRIADRIVSINMIGTQIIAVICILALLLKEDYLADVALIYAMISFLSVVVLCKVYLGVHWSKQEKKEHSQNA